jgi:hypothetical protein
MMAEQLNKRGVEHELITITGGEHGLGGGDPKRIDAAYESALEFVIRHTRGKTHECGGSPFSGKKTHASSHGGRQPTLSENTVFSAL